jgi:hypothetical protein
MAVLVSPGVSISVIDQSISVGAGPGTVPLIFIATQSNKLDPTTTGVIAAGTKPANAGKVWSITSQRDLVSTFGDPKFYSVSGTSINGYPLNEYGLLAAYSYLGISNLALVVRADIDLAALEATPIEPTSPATVGTYWLDESTTGSAYGLFRLSGSIWTAVTPNYVYNFAAGTGTSNTPPAGVGSDGQIAIVFQTDAASISYWEYLASGYTPGWNELGSPNAPTVVIQSVWPSTAGTPPDFWIKTTSAAQGANIVIRKMDPTLMAFTQVEAPILTNDAAADTYYSTDSLGSTGQLYIEPVAGVGATSSNELEIRYSSGASNSWAPLEVVIGSQTTPTNGPTNGEYWFNGLLGLDSNGQSTIDILVSDGADHWENIKLPGFTLPGTTGKPTLYEQPSDPRGNVPAPTLIVGDIWVQTDATPYPVLNRWSGSAWVLVNNADQTTPNGIIFQDARPNPLFKLGGTVGTGSNNGGGNYPDLDPDAPQAALYPAGFLLWNTRFSSNVVKAWEAPYVYDGVTASPDNTNNGSTGRWVNQSGNNSAGVPYMGADAQQAVIVKAMKATIAADEAIRAEDLYLNLIAAPSYVEVIQDMLALNDDRGDTAFVVGDTPFTLPATGTSLQNWATNNAAVLDDGEQGLVSASKYFGTWYPSALTTNVDGTTVVAPPSHMALRTIAYNDQVAYPWFAPAGLQRGVVNNASAVGYVGPTGDFVSIKLNQGQRDVLYQHGVNPVRVMPQGGIVMYGQKTRQNYASATDRINVVRLENYVRYQLNNLVQPFLFEPNDTATRKAVLNACNSFFSELVTLRGLYDFLVVCDTSNNTPARIDANQLWIDVAIQPTIAVEFIYIPIRIKNTGASLTA